MGTREFPASGPSAGINSLIESNRDKPAVLRNSRFLIAVTMSGSVMAAIMSVCMLLMVISLVFLNGDFSAANGYSALRWGIAALSMGYMCLWLWKLGIGMAGYRVLLDNRGANFKLGTNKKPSDLFLAWDQITAIKYKRIGNAQVYYVQAKDGSEARFSSYTFFRPKKVARQIADRTGLAIQKI